MYTMLIIQGVLEDTRLKAKDTKKIRGQGQGQLFRGQTLSKPRTGMLEAKAKDQGYRPKRFLKKKQVFQKNSQAISKKGLQIFFRRSTRFQQFKKYCCPRAEDRPIFENLRLRGQGLDLRGQGQGLQNVFSRTSSRPRMFSRTPPWLSMLIKRSAGRHAKGRHSGA